MAFLNHNITPFFYLICFIIAYFRIICNKILFYLAFLISYVILALKFFRTYQTSIKTNSSKGGEIMVKVLVRDNNVEQALRVLKKKGQKEGLLREIKERKYYETGTAMKKRKKNEAVRRERKRISKEKQLLGY